MQRRHSRANRRCSPQREAERIADSRQNGPAVDRACGLASDEASDLSRSINQQSQRAGLVRIVQLLVVQTNEDRTMNISGANAYAYLQDASSAKRANAGTTSSAGSAPVSSSGSGQASDGSVQTTERLASI